MDTHQIIILIMVLIIGFMIGIAIGYWLGRVKLWKLLQKTKKNHDKLDLKYDPDNKEISLNGTHRIPAVVFTKKEIFNMFPKKFAKQIFKNSEFKQKESFD